MIWRLFYLGGLVMFLVGAFLARGHAPWWLRLTLGGLLVMIAALHARGTR